MSMKIKNAEWMYFKAKLMTIITLLSDEAHNIFVPDSLDNFEVSVNECVVHPVFSKNGDLMRVEYDFSLCDIQFRTISLSIYKDATRIEVTLKNEQHIEIDGNKISWSE